MQKSLSLAKPDDKGKSIQARQVMEIKQLLEGFNIEKHNIALFVIEVLKYVDAWNLPPAKDTQGMMSHGMAPPMQGIASILDFALSQPKVRDMFHSV